MKWIPAAGRTAAVALAMLCAASLTACTRQPRGEGILLTDEAFTLTRGEKIDSAQREFVVDGRATFVVIVEEDDADVKLTLSHTGEPPASIQVDSNQQGEEGDGIEIAVLDAEPASMLHILLESDQELARPGKARLRVLLYDAAMTADPAIAARLDAFRAWSAATNAKLTGEDFRKTAIGDIGRALAHLESPDGDPALAAWGRMIRSSLNHRQLTHLKDSLADAQRAERGFVAVGAARDAARARLLQSSVLIEIAHDKAAKEPSAEEAAQQAKVLLGTLIKDPELSAFERARALNLAGVLAYYVHEIPEARAKFAEVIPAFEAMGHVRGRLVTLGNLGALAAEQGDYRASTQYYDQIIANLDKAGNTGTKAALLFNAGRLDTYAGNIDRAIERLLRALELTRENKLLQNEARMLHGLGLAYWTRGDTAQAATLLGEALKLRRTFDDPLGLNASLAANGTLAREAGDVKKALTLHREAVSQAVSADMRVKALLELALDYQAASDYTRAISTAREALAVPVALPNFYKRHAVQLALADMLLSQPRRTPQALPEATALAQEALVAAVRHGDVTQEIAGRRLLAQSLAARGSPQEARAEFEKAIALIFRYRSTINNPELRAITLSHEQQTFRGYVDLLMRGVAARGAGKLQPATADEENALRTLEWARAINFASARGSQLDASTQAKVDELLARMAGKRVRIAVLLDRTDDVTRDVDVLRLDIAELRAEVDRLRSTPAATSTTEGSPTVDAPWPALPAGTVQLSYALETTRAYLWVRDASGIRVTMLAATPVAIAKDLAAFSEATRARQPQRVDELLARLSNTLLPTGVLGENPARLEVVAEGQIARIPFAGLRTSAGSRQVLEQKSIVMIDSLFRGRPLQGSTKVRPLGLIALASGPRSQSGSSAAMVFPGLQSAAAEVNSIATLFQQREPPAKTRLLLGDDGSAGNLKSAWTEGVEVIHFATHGLADLRQPLASLLLLPARDASGNPTYLTAGQVQEWRGDADLVYLSACETAVGPARFAEGLPGLQRAFLRAGARGVIATLWSVEDMYAGQFAADFYRRYTKGVPASQALSETQRAWMEPASGIRQGEQAYRRMTAWAHVLYAQ
jgi:CHAT domain-containing protein